MNSSPATDLSQLRLGISTSASDVYRNPFRIKRMRSFLCIVDSVLQDRPICRVLDVGGMPDYWTGLRDVWSDRNLEITIVNLEAVPPENGPFRYVQGDACSLSELADNAYDVVHSNSVIEHVGGWTNKRKMASEIRRLAPNYFVQTPNYWFPFEPHLRTPFIHWLPRPLQRKLIMSRRSGFYPKAHSIDEAYRFMNDAEMLDMADMRLLFPDAQIERERFAFMTKSLIAVRH